MEQKRDLKSKLPYKRDIKKKRKPTKRQKKKETHTHGNWTAAIRWDNCGKCPNCVDENGVRKPGKPHGPYGVMVQHRFGKTLRFGRLDLRQFARIVNQNKHLTRKYRNGTSKMRRQEIIAYLVSLGYDIPTLHPSSRGHESSRGYNRLDEHPLDE